MVSALGRLFGFGGGDTDDITRSSQQQREAIQAGQRQATDNLTTGLENANAFLQPTINRGEGANNLLATFLGLNGNPAQAEAFGNFQNDPGFNAIQDAQQRGILRAQNAVGSLNSPATLEAIARQSGLLQNQFFNDRLNRLTGVGNTGVNAAGAASSNTLNTGNQLANLNFGAAQQIGNSFVNQQNAIAQQRQVPVNNLTQTLGTIAQLVGAATGTSGTGQRQIPVPIGPFETSMRA